MEDELDKIIAGSRVGEAWPGVYVVGTLDDRITLYTQQVRAMNLACALVERGEQLGDRILVVGAGAAGLSLAASLALLLPGARVDVYELASEAVHLQASCAIRNLHPHIYDWPNDGSKDEATHLPILNWAAGSARQVARQLTLGFNSIMEQVNQDNGTRLRPEYYVKVNKIQIGAHELMVDCEHRGGDNAPERFSSVFLAVGFGEEESICGAKDPPKYWFDGGLPPHFPMGKDSTTVIVSGNGDGGLIDLAANTIEHFNHADLIRIITTMSPSFLCEKLLKLEEEIFSDEKINIIELYDDRKIVEDAASCNLMRSLEGMMMPRRQVIFHTKNAFTLQRKSSILNRFTAYLLLRARPEGGSKLRHVHGSIAVENLAQGRYTIDGETITADFVVFRHGADRIGPLAPLGAGRNDYVAESRWRLAADSRQRRPPELLAIARKRLSDAAIRSKLPAAHPSESPVVANSSWSPSPSPCLRICVAAAGRPLGHPLNLLMILTARRLPAIAVIVGVDPRVLDGALQTARALAQEVNAQVRLGRGAAAGIAELPIRTWAVAESPAWPTADGARGLIWSPREAQPRPADLAEALRGARWRDDAQAGDLLVIALATGGEEAALALAHAIRDGSLAAPHPRRPAMEIPVYAWSRVRLEGTGREADIRKLEADRPALARLRRILDESGAPADLSQTVECAREMRLFTGDGPSPAWRRASREAVELHDLSLLTQRGGRAERPPLSEGAIAADLVSLAAQNEAILGALTFLPVARPVLKSLLQPANGLARLALGLVSEDEMRRERTIGNLGRISGAVPAPEALFLQVAADGRRDNG